MLTPFNILTVPSEFSDELSFVPDGVGQVYLSIALIDVVPLGLTHGFNAF